MVLLLDNAGVANAAAASLTREAEQARLAGWRVIEIDSRKRIDLGDLAGEICLLSGFVGADLAAVERAVQAAGARMLQSAAESALAMELKLHYELVSDLTARSAFVFDQKSAAQAVAELGVPLFVKGEIKSRKEEGLPACIARSEEELIDHLEESTGVLVARRLMPLRVRGENDHGFPISREYRVFVACGETIGRGFYWGGRDPWGDLNEAEENTVAQLAFTASRRLRTPLLVADVAQLTSGQWKLIELGDPQFTAVTQMPALSFYSRVSELLEG